MAKKDKPMAATGTIALATAAPKLGQPCVFTVTTEGLHGNQNPRVEIRAYQGEELVYGEARNLDEGGATCTFTMGGGSSPWLSDTPPADAQAPASCVALLYYWKFNPVQEQMVLAGPISFDAAGL